MLARWYWSTCSSIVKPSSRRSTIECTITRREQSFWRCQRSWANGWHARTNYMPPIWKTLSVSTRSLTHPPTNCLTVYLWMCDRTPKRLFLQRKLRSKNSWTWTACMQFLGTPASSSCRLNHNPSGCRPPSTGNFFGMCRRSSEHFFGYSSCGTCLGTSPKRTGKNIYNPITSSTLDVSSDGRRWKMSSSSQVHYMERCRKSPCAISENTAVHISPQTRSALILQWNDALLWETSPPLIRSRSVIHLYNNNILTWEFIAYVFLYTVYVLT